MWEINDVLRKSTINDIKELTAWNIDECIVGGAVLFGAEELFVGRDDESVYYEKRASQSSACTQRAL